MGRGRNRGKRRKQKGGSAPMTRDEIRDLVRGLQGTFPQNTWDAIVLLKDATKCTLAEARKALGGDWEPALSHVKPPTPPRTSTYTAHSQPNYEYRVSWRSTVTGKRHFEDFTDADKAWEFYLEDYGDPEGYDEMECTIKRRYVGDWMDPPAMEVNERKRAADREADYRPYTGYAPI